MMQTGECVGARAGSIAEKMNLSRSAESHHLKMLKDVGLLKNAPGRYKNYYCFNADAEAMNYLLQILTHAKEIMESLTGRSG